jgi:hypothetical protein
MIALLSGLDWRYFPIERPSQEFSDSMVTQCCLPGFKNGEMVLKCRNYVLANPVSFGEGARMGHQKT